jgi:4-hydroxybenzoate polyprenyltransferase
LGHGILVASFSFSAISYSRICRGAAGFVSPAVFFAGIFTTISLFLLVRIFDEFKDQEDDAAFRRHLPVPRGLMSLRELMVVGIVAAALQIAVNAFFFPKMLVLYFAAVGYLLLMGREFFVAEWLKKHPFWYVTSHMLIIPLIDIYASGLDWLLASVPAPKGLLFFFGVSFMSGIVLEIGRKIRAPHKEATGVLTYTSMLGVQKAVLLWIALLAVTLLLIIAASHYAGFGLIAAVVLGSMFLLCLVPALIFLRKRSEKVSKLIEYASALWAVSMYLALGGIPMLQQLISA